MIRITLKGRPELLISRVVCFTNENFSAHRYCFTIHSVGAKQAGIQPLVKRLMIIKTMTDTKSVSVKFWSDVDALPALISRWGTNRQIFPESASIERTLRAGFVVLEPLFEAGVTGRLPVSSRL